MPIRSVRFGVACAAVLVLISTFVTNRTPVAAQSGGCGVDLKLLVMSADGSEADLPAIKHVLDYLGTPYDVFIDTQQPAITSAQLANGCHGFYQGIVYTTGDLGYVAADGTYQSAYESGEQTTLDTYASQFGARQLVWYVYPSPTYGFNWPTAAVDTTSTPVDGAFTSAGAAVFGRVNTAHPLTIRKAYAYLATPLDASTTPLMVDASGHALAASRKYSDGRETLALTFDSNPYLTHTLVLGYDLINWVTRGLFLGERHVYMSPQLDDLFLSSNIWTPDTACGTSVDATTTEYRITGSDYHAFINWQKQLHARPLASNVKLTWAFNGFGASGEYEPDTLTPVVKKNAPLFYFVSHTWDHENMDAMTASAAQYEIQQNDWMAGKLKLNADAADLVTPDVSGLTNPAVMQTAYANGVRYIVTDTSRAGYDNPSPNVGIWNPLAPGLFMIPRRPTNLYFNVTTPEEWVAEYNCMYQSYWGRAFSYSDVLNNISDTWVGYLLKGDIDPIMFHAPNSRAYDGAHSLLGDLIDQTVTKYSALVKFPILSPTMRAVGDRMIARAAYNASGVHAMRQPGVGLVLTAQNAATIPVTGLKISGAESYAGQSVAYVRLAAGQTRTIPLP